MEKDELIEFIEDEFTKIDATYSALKAVLDNLPEPPGAAEAASAAAFTLNIYSGIERVLVNVLLFDKLLVQDTPDRHERILEKSLELGIVPTELQKPLAALLGLRIFFINRYLIDLAWDDLKRVTDTLGDTIGLLKDEVLDYMQTI